MRWLYRLIADLAGPPVVLAASLRGRFGGRWRERLGFRFHPRPARSRPRVWFHGASVGEVRSAAAVIEALLAREPDLDICLSSGTPAGLATAESLFRAGGPRVSVMAAPLDFWGAPARTLARLRPSALVILETELWPNLIFEARAGGTRLMLAAGRLTDRSFRRYGLARGFMARLLGQFDLLAASGSRERDLFARLGAPADRLAVLGNPKFDRLAVEADSEDLAQKKIFWSERLWGGGPRRPLIVAGSTHPGEEDFLLAAWSELRAARPDLALLLAPRHLNRVPEVLALAEKRGVAAVAASAADSPLLDRSPVVALDSLGQLTALYGLADVVVIGGSLRPGLTGHNPLEPAAVAAPMLFGPHMVSFAEEARGLLMAGGARETAPDTLAADLERWLGDPEAARAAGRAARDWLNGREPAAPALAEALLALLRTPERGAP